MTHVCLCCGTLPTPVCYDGTKQMPYACRFFELVESGAPFSTPDYMAPTPDWAVYGAPEAGFDPVEVCPCVSHACGCCAPVLVCCDAAGLKPGRLQPEAIDHWKQHGACTVCSWSTEECLGCSAAKPRKHDTIVLLIPAVVCEV
jgi:hypothetical protein